MVPPQSLSFIINHVFLPPKLPQKDDSDAKLDLALIMECQTALELFKPHFSSNQQWATCAKMLSNMLKMRDESGDMISDKVEECLELMVDKDVLAFHIRGQNACLIIRNLREHVSFESFELSPTTESVMTTKGRLRRCFPAAAIAVKQDRIADPTFRKALAQLLVQLDVETPNEVWPVVFKAKTKTIEIRDSIHPKYVTEMLTSILCGIGWPLEVARVHKRTRDDVLWKNTLKPWRRSPLWLLLRVALQTTILTGEDVLHRNYKSFMIFFMAHILQRALEASLQSDLLFVMSAKISQRILKLAIVDDKLWMQHVHTVVESTRQELATRWNMIEGNPDPFGTQRTWNLSKLSFPQDSALSLLKLSPYLSTIKCRVTGPSASRPFAPDCPQRTQQSSSVFPTPNLPVAGDDPAIRLYLADLEYWVQDQLNDWLAVNLDTKHTCVQVADLIKHYTFTATSAYADNPKEISLMFLTSMELWVALDRCTCKHYTLLGKYDPGFPPSLFDPMLLPEILQMERLARVEKYLERRRGQSSSGFPSIFHNTKSALSFAVQYFEQSPMHQELRREIETAADNERDRKKAELVEKRQKYQQLMQESNSASCQYETRWIRSQKEQIHNPNCRKCRLKSTAQGLRITVHEWPLPVGELEAKSAVFELDVPLSVAKWRDTTYGLLIDTFSPPNIPNSHQKGNKQKLYRMGTFNGLSQYFQSRNARLELASSSKSFVVAHYGSKPVSQATQENICVPNGLRYSMYDLTSEKCAKDLLGRCDVWNPCTLQLAPGRYQKLQFALNGTTHTSNEVLARQSECPKSVNLHEFYAFATLRSGDRLQWRNIARELVPRVLNFNLEETSMLVLQAAWQAGRTGNECPCRESHIDLKEEEFAISLLSVLEEALGAIEGNWQGAVAVRTFAALASRLLSVSPFKMVHNRCILFLRRARKISLQWTREVSQLLHDSEIAEDLDVLNLTVFEIALTCYGTFNVDVCHLPDLLRSNDDIAAITECSIVVHDCCPAISEDLSGPLKTLLQQYRRLSHRLESSLRMKILADRIGIDSAIRQLWAGYRPGRLWTALPKPSHRWLVTQTSGGGGLRPMIVHYNVLDGSLLVDGSPLTRLPLSYEVHPTYCRLFSQKILEVVPSTMDGMIFETRNEISGQQVHFAMYGSELVIRTRKDKHVCELVPLHALNGDFPRAFVQDYAHWFNLSTESIEWRPLSHALVSSSNNWELRFDAQNTSTLNCRARVLIDIRSETAISISRVLSPLEEATHIHVILNRCTGGLEIHLPRLKLDFFVNDCRGLLESKQFRGMIVDKQQSFGAFTGLVNKLVLSDVEGLSRSVVVPRGSVSFGTEGHHVRVVIDTTEAINVRYHVYSIDSQLGRLVDTGDLQSRLFRFYIHGLTSHCLVDRLTGRTGTEEALCGLAGGATHSFIQLQPVDCELLKAIAQLTPQRQFYPPHLRVMQQVKWETLSPLSQHCGFYQRVESILDQAKSFEVFQEQPSQPSEPYNHGNLFLLERSAIRDSSFQVHDFGAESFTTCQDVVYNSRDLATDNSRGRQTICTAKLVDNWSVDLEVCQGLLSEIEAWGEPILGPGLEDNLTLGFSLQWIDLPANFLPKYWCSLHRIFSHSVADRDKYKIMILLSTLSYSPHAKQDLVQTLLALATVPELRAIQPPTLSNIRLVDGYAPVHQRLVHLIEPHERQFSECAEYDLPTLPYESSYNANIRRRDQHQIAKDKQITIFAHELVAQWPTSDVLTPTDSSHANYILVDAAAANTRSCFQSWYRNVIFKSYVEQMQLILDDVYPATQLDQGYSFTDPIYEYRSCKRRLNFGDLTRCPAPCVSIPVGMDFDQWIIKETQGITIQGNFQDVLTHVSSQSCGGHQQKYAEDLLKSFQALREDSSVGLNLPAQHSALLKTNLRRARDDVDSIFLMICRHLQLGMLEAAYQALMLPRLSPISILSYLARDRISTLPGDWKIAIVQYGLSITALQRAERLASAGNLVELLNELENPGHRDWDPMCTPEWLLLEIENNILIRQDQAQISREMISPSSRLNSVMQLNMGLGKSSVIVPIVAATLADRTKLVRVVVLKPLARQMFHSLANKLGGVLNRRIFYMPISRDLQLNVHQAQQIRGLYEECMKIGGILLLQPEHILSFELMGLERLLSGDTALGKIMVQTQNWLRVNSRDILDESDEILSVRFELIYTIGTQRPIEHSPDRWTIIQSVLGVLGDAAIELQGQFPRGLEVLSAPSGGIPRVRILQPEAGDKLLDTVASKVCETGLPGVPMCYFPRRVRLSLLRFITDLRISETAILSVREALSGSDLMRNGLLLLRGLFAGRILKFAFEQKRWRVNFGPDPSRTMLVVPYLAKDTPAVRAEFSHPDVTIVLTSLAYYYGGISDKQIRESLEALLQSDLAKEEYEKWVKDAPGLPAAFREINGINLKDRIQCSRQVFPPLRFARSTVNFYLSTLVFPKDMKEFPHKLSSSGWDIAREKVHPTTGFSGTNDSRYILPEAVKQSDLAPQLSTNAAVLNCLLRPENSVIEAPSATGILDAKVLLKMALDLKPPVRVILDVGAQVLELQNEEFVHAWLSEIPELEAQAAIFFDNRNEMCVLSRDGTKEPLLISPFARQMDQCVVYLDESHTRGTDLKMPVNYRAIVTLGPGLTKDRLVQACMRMRKLGKGQSVVFCYSMEVERKIRQSSGNVGNAIEMSDVLKWCIAETIAHTKKSIPLWATQGVRHQRRQGVYSTASLTPEGLSRDLAQSLLELEAQTLQQRYGDKMKQPEEQIFSNSATDEFLILRKTQVDFIRAKCQEFEVTSFGSVTLTEEQERELSPEKEREQQVELPPALQPKSHVVHEHVRQFVIDGVLNRFSDAFQPAFNSLWRTTARHHYGSGEWPVELLVTNDFTQTVQASEDQYLDWFMRPVHWVLSCKRESGVECVVLSPFEAQELLPLIRKSKFAMLHVYSPRLTASARTLEDLSFCSIPAVLRSLPSADMVRHLNLFAGQLYIRSFEGYTLLSDFLGLCSCPPSDDIQVACDGFISPASRAKSGSVMKQKCPFTESPVNFLRKIIVLRRKGQTFAGSHLGKILNGELLEMSAF